MGKTTDVKESLFGDIDQHSQLLKPLANKLQREDADQAFSPLFDSLPYRSISVGSMQFCYALSIDLKNSPPSNVLLQAVGMLCFHISTHDDLVDEPLPPKVSEPPYCTRER